MSVSSTISENASRSREATAAGSAACSPAISIRSGGRRPAISTRHRFDSCTDVHVVDQRVLIRTPREPQDVPTSLSGQAARGVRGSQGLVRSSTCMSQDPSKRRQDTYAK